MAPSAIQQVLLSPAELSYLHTSLSLSPPIRSDGRAQSQFRSLVAETGILPGTNGSARICFADGTEAVVGIKAEVEKSLRTQPARDNISLDTQKDQRTENFKRQQKQGSRDWVDVEVDIPGFRDDDSLPIFMAAVLKEALLADVEFIKKLWINCRFHWKLYLDVLLLSQPLSYPLPLLSLTSHLALLSTRLPRLKSEGDEDPIFDDDWDTSIFLYPRDARNYSRPPVTLLVMAVNENIIFDPSKEELAVAGVVLAVSVAETAIEEKSLRLLAVRTIDPPSRYTYPGIPNILNTAAGGISTTYEESSIKRENLEEEGVWQPPRGGAKRRLIAAILQQVLAVGGVTADVFEALNSVELT